jgi:H+-translocating NAD(P) transhydrogenase subunit alpha
MNMNFLLASEPVAKLVEASTEVASTSADTVMLLLTVFVLAVFIGVEVITKIPPTLHTPLMSGSNAISGIALVGAVLAAGSGDSMLPKILGCVAVTLATINVVGGFMVTHRMLGMFRRKD